MTGVTGDYKGLQSLTEHFDVLASGRFRAQLSKRLAAAARHEVQSEFNGERDPYGERWKPLVNPSKKRGGTSAKILQDTRRLRNSMVASSAYVADSGGFTISTNVEYAAAHNYGAHIAPHSRKVVVNFNTRGRFARPAKARTSQRVHATWENGITIPKRQFLPSEGRLGPVWTEAFRKETEAFVHDLFKDSH
jgi:phage virion morphogenesis protein